MRASRRRAVGAALTHQRCPSCNRMGDLTPTAWQPLTLHCPRCGWHGHPLVAYTHPTHQRVNHRTIATLDVAWLEEAAS